MLGCDSVDLGLLESTAECVEGCDYYYYYHASHIETQTMATGVVYVYEVTTCRISQIPTPPHHQSQSFSESEDFDSDSTDCPLVDHAGDVVGSDNQGFQDFHKNYLKLKDVDDHPCFDSWEHYGVGWRAGHVKSAL